MVIHLLKLIRSRLGGSCWILVELLVVFVILWFMMYYFVAQGMLTRMPVGFKLDQARDTGNMISIGYVDPPH